MFVGIMDTSAGWNILHSLLFLVEFLLIFVISIPGKPLNISCALNGFLLSMFMDDLNMGVFGPMTGFNSDNDVALICTICICVIVGDYYNISYLSLFLFFSIHLIHVVLV